MDEEAAAAGAAAAEKFAATEPSLPPRHAIPNEQTQDWWGTIDTRPQPAVAVRRRFAPLGKLPIAGAALVIVAAVVFLLVNTGGPHQPDTGRGGIAAPSAGPPPCCEDGTLPPTPGPGQPGSVGATGRAGPAGSAGPDGTGVPAVGHTQPGEVAPIGGDTRPTPTAGAGQPASIGDGTVRVGTDVPAGTYTVHAAPAACSWTIQHQVGLVGGLLGGGEDTGGGGGDHTVKLADGDRFTTAHCGTWRKQP